MVARDTNCFFCRTYKKTRSNGCEWHVYRRDDGRFGWHLIGDNGSDIIATDGGQGYEKANAAEAMMRKIRSGHYSACPTEPSSSK